jgi:uncharacterized protein (DUF1800 family)
MRTRGIVRVLVTAFAAVLAGNTGLPASSTRTAVPEHPDDKTIVHVLNRTGFGPEPGAVDRIRRGGLARYLDQQLEPEKIPDSGVVSRLSTLRTLQESSRDLAQGYFVPAMIERRRAKSAVDMPASGGAAMDARRTPEERAAMMQEREVLAELAEQKILRAAYSERQLQEVMVDFWFNHFNVFAGKGATRVYLTEYERDAIRPNALGKFRSLLGATAQSPAMLFYLDNWESAAPEGSRPDDGRHARPQKARTPGTPQRVRGLNENYARELMELHTLGVDGGYTQHDVQEVARAFSGWTIAAPRQGGAFRFDPRMHDDGAKVVLGHRIRAGGGRSDGEQVLDILAAHPATARFIATKLVRRFVSDVPPPALVERVSAVYRESGGDIRDVVRAILTSPEFFAPDAYRAKVKTPFEFVVSAVRATRSDAQNALPLVRATRELGMPLYYCQPPTGYADRADAWVNTGALLNRMNFAVALTKGDLRGVASSAGSAPVGVNAITHDVLADDVSAVTGSTVARATGPAQGIALLLGSPEFQRK